MTLIFFGVGFGLLLGLGIFFGLIYPALKERKKEEQDR
jgi:hypothetical protein